MPDRTTRSRTGNPELDRMVRELLDEAGASANRDLLVDITSTVVKLATDDADRLDLKITSAALKEMSAAFRLFASYRGVPKVTIFGSARTLPDDPLYAQTRDVAHALAENGWMVITGAGPGIMAAGLEGAGRESAIGVNIRLPFEQGANEFIAADPKLIEMKYFFTRKLMLMKESAGFLVLPGGFGTLDEMLELLTLQQTGKADPTPIVLLEVPGGTFWHAWEQFIESEVLTRGLISPDDVHLYCVTDDVQAATDEILGFYRTFHSRRFVGDVMVIRLRQPVTEEQVQRLSEEFGDICLEGGIWITEAMPPEVADNDNPELPRIAMRFDRIRHGRLRQLIDALNRLAP